MTLRLSTGARNGIMGAKGFDGLFNKASINIYSGTQPATADTAVSGTLLGTVTVSSGALTLETRAAGSVTVTGSSGTVTAVTVGTFNIIPDDATIVYTTSTAVTAGLIADAINRNGYYEASSSGAVVTITPRAGTGAAHNGYVVSSTGTCTATYGNIASGAAPVNALMFNPVASGAISKLTGQTWSFAGVAAGTAGWFRLVGSSTDAGGTSTTLPRIDGSIATSGADLNLSNIAIAVGAPATVDSFTFTAPAQ